jgi:gliding motility-associated-like protein
MALSLMFAYAQISSGQCMLGAQVPIEDLETLMIPVNIEGLVNDDLSDQGQGICGVSITFRHDQIGDISIQLVSPSGQVVNLVGPTGAFGATDFTTWDVSFIPCGDFASPDPGFSNNWNNGQNWGVFGNYSGAYFPFNGCLEDFNSGSANGEWTIIIRDAQEFDEGILLDFNIIFCDPTGIECTTCTPEPGDFAMNELNACSGDTALAFVPALNFPGTLPDPTEYGYIFVLSIGDSIIQFTDSLRMDTFPPSVYEIRGLSYVLKDSGILINYADSTIASLENIITSPDTNICAELTFPPMNVNIYRIPEIQIDGDTLSCSNDRARLNAMTNTPFSTYIWTDINGENDTAQAITTSIPGIYGISVFSNFGCRNDSSYELLIDTISPSLELSDTILPCPESEFIPRSLTNASLPLEWILPSGDTIREYAPTLTGTGVYTVVARADNGCSAIDTLIATTDYVPPGIVIGLDSINCERDSGSLTVENFGDFAFISITDPFGRQFETSFLKTDQSGTYIIELITFEGCIITDSAEIIADTVKPEVRTSLSAISCANGEFELTASWTDIGSTFEWLVPGGGMISDPTIQVNVAGLYVAVLTGRNRCFDFDSLNVPTQLPDPDLEIIGDTLECRDTSVVLEAVTVGSGVSVMWSGPSSYESEDPVVEVSQTGLYVVTATDSIGCQAIDSFDLVRVGDRPSFAISLDSINCVKDTATIELELFEADAEAEWTGLINFDVVEDSVVLVFEPGSLDLRISFAGGCTYDTTISVSADTILPDLRLQTTVTGECSDQVVLLQSIRSSTETDQSIFWDTDNGNLIGDPSMQQITADKSGSYTLIVTDMSNGCSVDTNFTIEVQDGPDSLILIGSDPGCADPNNGSIQVFVFGGQFPFQYALNGGSYQDDSIFRDLSEGLYTIDVIDTDGCEISASTELMSAETFTVEAGEDQVLTDPASTILMPESSLSEAQISNSSWTYNGTVLCTDCDTLMVASVEAGIYIFTVTDTSGCSVSDFLEITILEDFNIFIPTAFSPNGDGINDAFELFWTGSILGVKEVYIFDRWGDKVFEFDPTAPVADPIFWDGTFNGKPCQDGLYVYYIVFLTSEGVDEERRGEVQIIR